MPLLFALMGISLVATLLILLLPPLVLGTRLPRQPGVLGFLLYFLFIGAGYILIEVALIQKFVLFLGHPTYALTVVIFSMLVSSGMGSYFSRRMLGDNEERLIKALALVAMLAALLAAVLRRCYLRGVWLPLALKGRDDGGADRAARVRHGHAVSHRAASGWRSGTRLRCAGPGR